MTSGTERLLLWCKKNTEEYEDVSITDFSTSWKDGLGFCALLHKFLGSTAIDFMLLQKDDPLNNLQTAFSVAEDAGIASLMSVEDMNNPDVPSVITYLSQYYTRFHTRSNRLSMATKASEVPAETSNLSSEEQLLNERRAKMDKLRQSHRLLIASNQQKCARCQKIIEGETVELRIIHQHYHKLCFTCNGCNVRLRTQPTIVGNHPYCDQCATNAETELRVGLQRRTQKTQPGPPVVDRNTKPSAEEPSRLRSPEYPRRPPAVPPRPTRPIQMNRSTPTYPDRAERSSPDRVERILPDRSDRSSVQQGRPPASTLAPTSATKNRSNLPTLPIPPANVSPILRAVPAGTTSPINGSPVNRLPRGTAPITPTPPVKPPANRTAATTVHQRHNDEISLDDLDAESNSVIVEQVKVRSPRRPQKPPPPIPEVKSQKNETAQSNETAEEEKADVQEPVETSQETRENEEGDSTERTETSSFATETQDTMEEEEESSSSEDEDGLDDLEHMVNRYQYHSTEETARTNGPPPSSPPSQTRRTEESVVDRKKPSNDREVMLNRSTEMIPKKMPSSPNLSASPSSIATSSKRMYLIAEIKPDSHSGTSRSAPEWLQDVYERRMTAKLPTPIARTAEEVEMQMKKDEEQAKKRMEEEEKKRADDRQLIDSIRSSGERTIGKANSKKNLFGRSQSVSAIQRPARTSNPVAMEWVEDGSATPFPQGWILLRQDFGMTSRWKRRLIRMQEDTLFYWSRRGLDSTVRNGRPKGSFSLLHMEDVRPNADGGPCDFTVVTREMTLNFRAGSEDVMFSWMEVLIHRMTDQKYRNPPQEEQEQPDKKLETKEGVLRCKIFLSIWKDRFVVLKGGVLFFFQYSIQEKKGKKGKPINKFALYGCTMNVAQSDPLHTSFELKNLECSMTLQTNTTEEMHNWMNAIHEQQIDIQQTINSISSIYEL